MSLLQVAAVTGLSVLAGSTVTVLLCLERRTSRAVDGVGDRLREVAPYLGLAAAVLLCKQLTHGYRLRFSRAFGWNITDDLYAIEGGLVATLQGSVPAVTLEFFSAAYVLGFAVLLVTATVLYLLSPSRRRLEELLVAFVVNYAVGSACYTLFVAYGPRNRLAAVDGLMYEFYPATQTLTAAVSANTNVFPSLHTSLAVTVALLAWRSRREYPRWTVIAGLLASSVVFSTMYLGIHWFVDVVAGALLGVGSVYAADRIVERVEPRSADRRGDARMALDDD